MNSRVIQVTPHQRAIAIEALEVMWPSVPARNVYPRLFRFRGGTGRLTSVPDCNTVACFGGWCPWWPAFAKQGVDVDMNGSPMVRGRPAMSVTLHLFGDPTLFFARHGVELVGFADLSDHEIVTLRLKRLIENSKVKELT